MNRTKQMVEASLIAALLVILMIGSYYMPFLSTLFYIIMPLPVIILMIRNTLPNAVVVVVVSTLISAAAITIIGAVTNGLLALFVGIPLGFGLKHKYEPLKCIGIGGLGALLAHIIIFVIIQFFMGISPVEQIQEMFNISSAMQSEMNSLMSNLNNESLNASLEETEAILSNMAYYVQLILPAAVILFSMVYSAINYLFVRPVLSRLRISVPPLGTFDNFRYPKHMGFGGGFMLVMAYFVAALNILDPQLILANFVYLFSMVFLVQGLALAYYYLKRLMPRGFAIACVVFLLLSQFSYYIALIGFIDVIIDFRSRIPKRGA